MEKNYVTPEMEVIEIAIEKGFVASPDKDKTEIGGKGEWD